MSVAPATWREEDEEFRVGEVKGALKPKPRFSYHEIKTLLDAVKRNRFILLRKFNQGVSAESKKQTWAEITDQVNGLGENYREVRQIMKKWTDLKCDGKRRIVALRGPNGMKFRKKKLGPVEKMVHKILMMSPSRDGNSDPDLSQDEDFSNSFWKGPTSSAPPYSYLSMNENSQSFPEGFSIDLSPLSSPEKELGDPLQSSSDFDLAEDGEQTMDFGENDDSMFSSFPPSAPPPSTSHDLLPSNSLLRIRPIYTYSRTNQNQNQNSAKLSPGPSSTAAPPSSQSLTGSTVTPSSLPPPPSSLPPPPSPLPPPPSSATTNGLISLPAASSNSIPPPPSTRAPSAPPPSSSSNPTDPLPLGSSQRRSQEQVAQLSSQSLQQQRASRMLLTSVSQSLETLAQSVQQLVESQQEFVQESLLLQRETVDILRDFSSTALRMLRDKTTTGPPQTCPPPPPPPLHHLPTPRF
ncbi:myb-related transcription factor, partner of profilin [Nothobranchius furzeri]|uniref:Myb-related transcription factor, partner of profilin-like n=2 Tax=Nothobranchius TaxID=28779 RepID=A0A8C6MHQ9_NOTFU|nr:transcript variant X1 [Nothobranchius furzeri]KAF7218331.1 transcript variant X3 [Nothobranchius furzeri]KAF7218332.1 transcript variant X2 [Nothobranchius furzeri]